MNAEAGELPGVSLYTCSVDVRWGDMDALAHLNNTVYLRFFEQARMEWYGNLERERFEDAGANIVIINAYAEFRRPIVYPASLRVEMSGSEPGNSSFMSHYAIYDRATSDGTNAEESAYCVGYSKIVWVTADASRSTAMPGSVRELLIK